VDLTLLAPLQFHASSAGMDSQGPVNANQRTFQQFKAQKLLAGAQMHVQLEGLPLPQPAPSPTPLNQNTLWLIVALLLMLAIVSVTWFIYRLSRHQTSRRGGRGVDAGRGPLGRPSPANPYPSSNGQQEALLQELLDLDTAYEAGKIKKTEYQERRANTKAQLRSLMEHDVVAKSATAKRTARRSSKGSS